MITLYCGLNEHRWNHHPVAPGGFACVAPVYGRSARTKTSNAVTVPPDTLVLQDSGAFSDKTGHRLGLEAALERQLWHADRYGYAAQVTHRASYDVLIDETWAGEQRHKERWSEADAQEAVTTTVKAAAYLTSIAQGKSSFCLRRVSLPNNMCSVPSGLCRFLRRATSLAVEAGASRDCAPLR